jgi:hypothetical protein
VVGAVNGALPPPSDNHTTLPDQDVISCMGEVYLGMTFPKPKGGIVTVAYPISFSPD